MSWPLYRIADSSRLSRRSFLLVTGSLSAAAVWSGRALGAVKRHIAVSDYPFQLGVASGDPTSTGVVLWTRLAPKPLDGGGMPHHPVEVSWQIAENERMTKGLRQGTTVASPDWAHSVHVEVEGLQPDRWYWYQFKAGGETSPVGRTRTMPAADSAPQELRFAFASCQNYENGFYTAYDHMAREELDLMIHLGDYIYESGPAHGNRGVRKHAGPKLDTLEQYRTRHAQYRSDAALQAMHAAVPWLVTWDDHEVENNYAGEHPQHAARTRDEFLALRARAYQAYYEHMPLRRSSLPKGPLMQLYRRIAFGPLAEFFVLDTRQFRTDQPCGDSVKEPCAGTNDKQATILGQAQRKWLFDGLKAAPAKWHVLAQQVIMARVNLGTPTKPLVHMDRWGGYEADRRRVLTHLRDAKVSNPIVLSGDIHSNWANELSADFERPHAAPIAAEFVGTSISSGGDGVNEPHDLALLTSRNPFIKFHNNERGYVRCVVTPKEWRTDFQTVEYVSKPGAPLQTRASFVVEAGQAKLNRV